MKYQIENGSAEKASCRAKYKIQNATSLHCPWPTDAGVVEAGVGERPPRF